VQAEADEEASISGQGQGDGRERGGMHDVERPWPSGDEELLDARPPKRRAKHFDSLSRSGAGECTARGSCKRKSSAVAP
jgi:hypothetical protein